MNFMSTTEARDAAFTELTTVNGNLSTKLRHQEDQIRASQAKLCNLKVSAAMRPIDVKTNKKRQTYERDKKQKLQWPTHLTEKNYNSRNYCWLHIYDTRNLHKSEKCKRKNMATRRSPREETQWGDRKTTRLGGTLQALFIECFLTSICRHFLALRRPYFYPLILLKNNVHTDRKIRYKQKLVLNLFATASMNLFFCHVVKYFCL